MGVLDEAIREHLELKRRNGADPAEVERLEHEAFGPITRDPAPPPAAVDEPAPAGHGAGAEEETPAGFDEPLEDDFGQPPTTGAPHLGLEPSADAAFAPPTERDPAPRDLEPPAGHAGGTSPTGFGVPADDPAAAPHDPGPRAHPGEAEAPDSWAEESWSTPAPPAEDQPTRAYSLEDLEELRRADEGAPTDDPDVVPADPEAHDELEETPDFLEETPEHDRLWFEQKPPKDFDF